MPEHFMELQPKWLRIWRLAFPHSLNVQVYTNKMMFVMAPKGYVEELPLDGTRAYA